MRKNSLLLVLDMGEARILKKEPVPRGFVYSTHPGGLKDNPMVACSCSSIPSLSLDAMVKLTFTGVSAVEPWFDAVIQLAVSRFPYTQNRIVLMNLFYYSPYFELPAVPSSYKLHCVMNGRSNYGLLQQLLIQTHNMAMMRVRKMGLVNDILDEEIKWIWNFPHVQMPQNHL